MNEEEQATFGTPSYDRVIRLCRERGTEVVVTFLSDDLDDVFGPLPGDYASMTVADYFDQIFWPVRSDPTSSIGVALTTSTAEFVYWRNVRASRGILEGEIGTTRLRDLTDQHWERWQEAQDLSGRSKVLRRNAYAALLTFARRQGHLDYKPEFFRIKGSSRRTREQVDPLSLDEVAALLKVANPMRRALWAVGIGQGLRPGELVRVRWEDIDWTERTMAVRGTKTEEAAAVIPMTPLALRYLRELWSSLGEPTEGHCFLYRGKPFKEYKGALKADAKKARIERHVTPYLLRHSFATLAWALGIPQDVARRVMRHTTNEMLDKVYCRPRPKDLVAKVAGFRIGGEG